MFLNDINQIADIEWAKSHYWDVMFTTAVPYNTSPPPPAPFNTWFPATAIEQNLATISSHEIQSHLSTAAIPLRSTDFTVSLTFFDDDNHTLTRWISDWINVDIFNDGFSVSPVGDIIRLMVVVKYRIIDGKKVPIGGLSPSSVLNPLNANLYGLKAYYVYPDTTFNFQGTSEAGILSYTVNFKVVGDVSLSATPSPKNQLITQVTNSVAMSRFIP